MHPVIFVVVVVASLFFNGEAGLITGNRITGCGGDDSLGPRKGKKSE